MLAVSVTNIVTR